MHQTPNSRPHGHRTYAVGFFFALMTIALIVPDAAAQQSPRPMTYRGSGWFELRPGFQHCVGESRFCKEGETAGFTLPAVTAAMRTAQHGFGFALQPNAFLLDRRGGGLFQFGALYEYHFRTRGRWDPFFRTMAGLHVMSRDEEQTATAFGIEPSVGLDYFVSHSTALGFLVAMPTMFDDKNTTLWAARFGVRFYFGADKKRRGPKTKKPRRRRRRAPKKPRKKRPNH